MGQFSMFPRCCCCVLGEKPRRRLKHCLTFDHPEAIFLIDLDSGKRSTERACHPFSVEELMKGAHSDLPHRCLEDCNFTLTECQESPRDVFPQELSHLDGPNFFGVDVLLIIHDAIFWDISCVLSRKRHSSGRSPVAHLTVRISRPRSKRFLWPAPAKETMASRCSCRSPVGPGALIGDSTTWCREAIPVLLRPCSLIPLRASLYRPPPQAIRAASAHSTLVNEFQCPSSVG